MTFPQEHELMCAACGWLAEGEPEEYENCQHKPLLKSWIRVRFNGFMWGIAHTHG